MSLPLKLQCPLSQRNFRLPLPVRERARNTTCLLLPSNSFKSVGFMFGVQPLLAVFVVGYRAPSSPARLGLRLVRNAALSVEQPSRELVHQLGSFRVLTFHLFELNLISGLILCRTGFGFVLRVFDRPPRLPGHDLPPHVRMGALPPLQRKCGRFGRRGGCVLSGSDRDNVRDWLRRNRGDIGSRVGLVGLLVVLFDPPRRSPVPPSSSS